MDDVDNYKFRRYLRAPIAVLGKWSDSQRTVEFTQKDFDDIIKNFKNDVLGFKPPFWIGHPLSPVSDGVFADNIINPYATVGGAPRSGYVVDIYQNGNYLMALVLCLDEVTYDAVATGKYGYTSAEVIRNYYSRNSDENLGTVLFALALTNTPFLPNLPSPDLLSVQQSFKPNQEMINSAKRGLEMRREFGRGGTAVGIARARDIVSGKNLSLSTVKRMHSFFSRHEVDKKATGFNYGEEGYPSNGRIAWELWGGDAGQKWAKSIIESINSKNRTENAFSIILPLEIGTSSTIAMNDENITMQSKENDLSEIVKELSEKVEHLTSKLNSSEAEKDTLYSQLKKMEEEIQNEKAISREQYEALAVKMQELSSAYEEAKKKLYEYQLKDRIKEIQQLAIEQAIKDQYIESLTQGKILVNSDEDKYRFEFLSSLSLKNKENLSVQRGSTEAEVSNSNPFERIIARNKELARSVKK